MNFEAVGQGSGLLGIPGDFTPPTRFVRTAATAYFANKVQKDNEAVTLAFHIFKTVDNPRGVPTSRRPIPFTKIHSVHYTLWAVVKDLNNTSIFFRDCNDLTIHVLRLANMKKVLKLKMKLGKSVGGFVDITDDLLSVNEHNKRFKILV